MQKIYLLLSILFFIQVDCLAQSFLPDESNIMSYEEILNLYPKSLTSHLPAKIDGMNLLTIFPKNKAIPKIVVETTLMIKADLKGIFILLVA